MSNNPFQPPFARMRTLREEAEANLDTSIPAQVVAGAVSEPSIQTGVTLSSIQTSTTITITNNDDSPLAVQLSDSLGYLTFLNPDVGADPANPSYSVVASGTRAVTFERAGGVPVQGGPWTTYVQGVLPGGSLTDEVAVVIEAQATIPNFMGTLTANLHAWDLTSLNGGDLEDNGGGTVTPIHGTLNGVALDTPHPTANALGGRIVFDASTDDVDIQNVPNVDTAAYGANKTLLVVFTSTGATTNRRVWGWYGGTAGNGYGFLLAQGAAAWTLENVLEGPDQVLDTNWDHTDTGASEQMGADDQVRQVIAVTWVRDAGTPANSQKIVRWKAADHARTGHSYLTRTVAEVADPGVGTDDFALGHTGQSGSSPMVMEGAWMLVDHAMDADEFNTFLDILGMSGT
jgi:hypothetical protein